jgi:predicted O-methyltransferase YrrM
MSSWWYSNFGQRLSFAMKNPGYALRAITRDVFGIDERFFSRVTGASLSEMRRYLNEPFHDKKFLEHLRRSESAFSAGIASASMYGKKVLQQYALVRAFKPELIVETGIASGVSSYYILQALKVNGSGTLHSIEIDDRSYLPPGREPGWIVPDSVRDRWRIHIGDARVLLPVVLDELRSVDVFIHDSLHSAEHMKFEFECAYPYLSNGGLLIADDALWNSSFPTFAKSVHAPAARIVRGVGVLKK